MYDEKFVRLAQKIYSAPNINLAIGAFNEGLRDIEEETGSKLTDEDQDKLWAALYMDWLCKKFHLREEIIINNKDRKAA